MTASFVFRRVQRLTSAAAFRRVYATGRAYRAHGLGLRVAPRPEGLAEGRQARLGMVIRRTVARTSVQRNRWKRWIRETFRRHPEALPPAWDVVVSVVPPAPAWGYREMEAALLELLARARQETLS